MSWRTLMWVWLRNKLKGCWLEKKKKKKGAENKMSLGLDEVPKQGV